MGSCFCTVGIPYSNAHFGQGTGPIFLDDVTCTTSADQLLECYSRPILSTDCAHSSDAGVGCESKCCTCTIKFMHAMLCLLPLS